MPKTGSTAVQNTLFKYSDMLTQHGIQYVKSMRNHGNFLIPFFEKSSEKGAPARMRSLLPMDPGLYVDDLVRQLEEFPKDLFILSGENLSPMSEEGARALYSFLERRFDNIDVVAFLRPPVSLINSLSQTKIINLGYSFSWFENNCLRLPYRQNLEKWKIISGDRFHARVFATTALDAGCVVATLLNIIGPPQECYDAMQVCRSNETLSLLSAELWCVSNEMFPPWLENKINTERASRLSAFLRRVDGPKFRVPSEFEQRSLACSVGEIEWVKDVLGIDLNRYDVTIAEEEDRLRSPLLGSRKVEFARVLSAINTELLLSESKIRRLKGPR